MRYFRLSYDTRQLSKKNIELINQTVIKKLGEKGFFSIPNNLCNEEKELFFRKMAREYFELISSNVGISGMRTYDLYPDEDSYQRQLKLIIDNYLIATADYEDKDYIKSILDSNEFLKNWLENTGRLPI